MRDLPQNLYDDLQQRAVREHRSMAQQTIVALEEHLQRGRQGEPRLGGTVFAPKESLPYTRGTVPPDTPLSPPIPVA